MQLRVPAGLAGKILWCSAVLLTCFLLKRYYSDADSQSLFWILAPTAYLVELFSGLVFVNEPGLGWFNQPHGVLIAPSCSGVNFLIMIFCMSSCQIIFSGPPGFRRFLWTGCCGLAAYTATLLVNSVRIWLSVLLLRADIYSAWLTPEAVHRIAGVTLYYLVLCFYYLFVSSILERNAIRCKIVGIAGGGTGRFVALLVPLAWYLLFALGVPLMNNAYQRQPALFVEHSLAVGSISMVLTVLVMLGIYGSRCAARWSLDRFAGVVSPVKAECEGYGKTQNSRCRG